MVISIQQGLKKILSVVQDVHSILITDKDGVTVVAAGEPVRNVASLTSSYATALDQSSKLNLGTPKYWTFMYETRQLVIFSRSPFVIYILASPKANNTALCSILDGHMQPILDECDIVFRSVMAGIST
uniref:Roadblock/LAMTOR2 domain-containing protein n=1 Tax=Panagrolaimus sp. JU765 TaxID=591449 RepID=A0AC34PWP7_9BILA